MKIFGDQDSSGLIKEPGLLFGSNDVLNGTSGTVDEYTTNWFCGTSHYSKTFQSKLYLHIPTNAWTTFTGKLREYFLPWRWKTAYLDQENGTQPCRILVCTSIQESELSDRLRKLIGKSWFLTNLISNNCYDEIFGQEFLCLEGQNEHGTTRISHPLGEMVGVHINISNYLFCHIYRPRSLFSTLKYHLLKQFSSSWKEVTIQIAQISEKVLIKKSDEDHFSSTKPFVVLEN